MRIIENSSGIHGVVHRRLWRPFCRSISRELPSGLVLPAILLAAMTFGAMASPDQGSTFSEVIEGPMFSDDGPFETSFWVDADADGYLDLFLTGGNENDPTSSGHQNAFYRNRGDGTFTRWPANAIPAGTANAGSQTWGDFDNDGYVDVFLGQWGSRSGALLRNVGNGTFVRIPSRSPLSLGDGPLAIWSDIDADGLLDLSYQVSGRNTTLRGLGDGTFVESQRLDSLGGWNRTASDFNGDGYPDLVVNTAPEGTLALYGNARDGILYPVTTSDVSRQASGVFGVASGDYDNDGYPDLFAARGPNGRGVLFHNEGGNGLREVTGLGDLTRIRYWNPHWVDYDNDGYLDLFVTGAAGAACGLYRNSGDGTFVPITEDPLATDVQADPYGTAWGDYDHNGFLDLFIPNQGGPHHLYRNEGNRNAWIQFLLVGTRSNRSAIGAKIRVQARIGGRETWQLREILGSEGYDGPGTLRAEFGLGDAASVDTVRIEWPSGATQEFHDLTPRRILTITEPSKLMAPRREADGSMHFDLQGAVGITFQIQASENLRDWSPVSVVTNRSRTEVVKISGTAAFTRYYRAIKIPPE